MTGAAPELSAPATSRGAPHPDSPALFRYTVALADDALISAQRMGEWIASAPQLEEDVALGNIALDLLGQARSLLTYAGQVEESGRDEDALAYFRNEREFLNVQLVERSYDQPDGQRGGDFAVAMARLLMLSTYQMELYSWLRTSTDETLSAIAAKAVKEVDYHRDHATMWVLRLGDGTEESHVRMQAGLDAEWPYHRELFEGAHVDPALLEAGVAVDPGLLREPWDARVSQVLAQATLGIPDVRRAVTGGRRGVHTEQMGYLLAEMQHLARSHPGATW